MYICVMDITNRDFDTFLRRNFPTTWANLLEARKKYDALVKERGNAPVLCSGCSVHEPEQGSVFCFYCRNEEY